MMADRALRAMRIGAQSKETEQGVEFAPRQEVAYDCSQGHSVVLPFAIDAEIPDIWPCRECDGQARLRAAKGDVTGVAELDRPRRTHWEILCERRTVRELEELLNERLEILRASRGEFAVAASRKSA